MKMKFQQTGLTLIELMVAVLLSSLLLLGLLQTFDANRQSNNIQMAFSRVQENGRIAMELIGKDIRMADYWGCQPDASAISNNLDSADEPYASNPGDYDWTTGDSIEIVDNASSEIRGSINVIDGTDILTIRTSVDACNATGKTHNMESANIKVSQSCDQYIDKGDILLLTNCQAGDLFAASTDLSGCGGNKCTLTHNTGTITPDAQYVDNATNFSTTYNSDARLLVPIKKTYFVANDVDGVPSLYLITNSAAPVQMVAGIETMQLSVGQDTDSNGSIDVFTTTIPTGAGALDNVLTVRAQIIARDDQNVNSSEADGLLRKTFVSTSTIRNRVNN